MRRFLRLHVIAFGLCALAPAVGEIASAQEAPADPAIGLVLSGGGAKGFAHLGVLKVLEEYRVPVHYVAGTSMGSIMGGLYASGLSTQEIEETLGKVDWVSLFDDQLPREELDYNRKDDDFRYLFDLGVGFRVRGGIVIPTGLLAGIQVEGLLRENTIHVTGIDDFDDFPIPFRAVAADIERGESYVLERGDLARSIRASMSIPGAFAPVEIDGRLLVDGGITDNMPVDLIRSLGADVVIAVDVSEPLRSREQLENVFGVVGQLTGMLTRLNVEAQIPRADILLDPELGELSGGDFTKFAELVAIGEAEARRHEAELRRYSVSEAEYAAYRERYRYRPDLQGRVDFVDVQGNERVDRRMIDARIRLRPGDPFDPAVIRENVTRVYGMGAFRSVAWDVERRGEELGVVIRVVEKPEGPNYAKFGMVLDDAGTFDGRMNLTLTQLNRRGAELRNDFQFGAIVGFSTEFYQPLDYAGTFFVAPSIAVRNEDQDVFDDDGDKVAVYEVDRRVGRFDVGYNIGRHGELRLGVLRGKIDAHVGVGAADLPDFDATAAGFRVALNLDRLDDSSFPERGYLTWLSYFMSREGMGADDGYDKLTLNSAAFWTRNRWTWTTALLMGSSLGSDIPAYDQHTLGGFLSLAGLQDDQLRGQYMGRARLGGYYRLATLPRFVGEGLFLGAFLETGQTWERSDEIFEDLIWSLSGFLGVDTFLGPFTMAYGVASTGQDEFYVSLGRNF